MEKLQGSVCNRFWAILLFFSIFIIIIIIIIIINVIYMAQI